VLPGDRDQPVGAWAFAAILGGVCGVLLNRDWVGGGPEGVGFVGLAALPLLFGILGGVLRPAKPARTALVLSVICLLVATPLLGESVACLIVIAPWHLVLSPLFGAVAGFLVRRVQGPSRVVLLLLGFGAAAASPVVDRSLADPDARETFADRVIVDAPPDVVWASIDRLQLDFTTPAPWVIAAALPQPLGIRGGGATPGSQRRVLFGNGVVLATVTASDPGRSFDLALTVERSGPEFFDHWAVLDQSQFELEALPDERTAISHVTTYRPLAYPRWYFAPVEHALGGVVQRYMLEAYAAEGFAPGRVATAP
jgi:hypothetical protein